PEEKSVENTSRLRRRPHSAVRASWGGGCVQNSTQGDVRLRAQHGDTFCTSPTTSVSHAVPRRLIRPAEQSHGWGGALLSELTQGAQYLTRNTAGFEEICSRNPTNVSMRY
ncbi:unnamed protein product, partial [Laminaria digitata]